VSTWSKTGGGKCVYIHEIFSNFFTKIPAPAPNANAKVFSPEPEIPSKLKNYFDVLSKQKL